MNHLHHHRVVHGDLKTTNLLVMHQFQVHSRSLLLPPGCFHHQYASLCCLTQEPLETLLQVKVSGLGMAAFLSKGRRHELQGTSISPSESSSSSGGDPHTFWGTPSYTAPEVLRGEQASQASDVYSFGIILWGNVTLNPGAACCLLLSLG